MALKRLVGLFIFILSVVGMTTAQEGYPLPSDLAVITPENVSQLEQLASLGGELPGVLSWSPDGTTLAIGSTAGVIFYDVETRTQRILEVEYSRGLVFDGMGYLYIFENRYDPVTGESVDFTMLDGNYSVESINAISRVTFNRSDGQQTTISLLPNFVLEDVIVSQDPHYAALVVIEETEDVRERFVQLWNLETDRLIAQMSQSVDIFNELFFHNKGDFLVVNASPYNSEAYRPEIQVYNGRTGERLNENESGTFGIKKSADKSFFAYRSGEGIRLWSEKDLGILVVEGMATNPTNAYFDFSPIQNHLITVSTKQVELYNLDETFIPNSSFASFSLETPISSAGYSKSGTRFYAATESGTIYILDAETLSLIQRIEVDAARMYTSINTDGTRVVTDIVDSGKTVIWDVETEEALLEVSIQAQVNSTADHAAYVDNGVVHVVSLNNVKRNLDFFEPFFNQIEIFDPYNNLVFFEDKTLRGYDLASSTLIIDQTLNDEFIHADLSDDGTKLLISDGYDGETETISLVNINSPKNVDFEFELPREDRWTLSPTMRYIAHAQSAHCNADSGGAMAIIDVETLSPVIGLTDYGGCGPFAYTFSSDDRWFLIDDHGYLIVMDVVNFPQLQSDGFIRHDIGNTIDRITLSQDDAVAAVEWSYFERQGRDSIRRTNVNLYHFDELTQNEDAEPYAIIEDGRNVTFSADGQFIVARSGLYSIEGKLLAEFRGDIAAFSPDSTLIAVVDRMKVSVNEVQDLANGIVTPLTTFVADPINPIDEIGFNGEGTLLYVQTEGKVYTYGLGN